MKNDDHAGRPTVSFEELAYSNMLIVQALVELLAEKKLLGNAEVMQRVKKLRRETSVAFRRANDRRQEGSGDLNSILVAVTAGDLISANMIMVEMLLALFVDKGFLTRAELEQLVADLKRKANRDLLQ